MDDSGRIAPAVETVSWPAAIAAMACISIAGIGLGLGAPLLSVLLEQRGYSATMIGINTAIGGVGSVLCAPLATPLAMRLGAANTMIGAALLGGASFIGFYFTQDYAVWLGLRFALHFALTLLFILSEFWIASSAPPSRRGFVLGIYATVLSLGFAAGPMLFAVLGSAGFAPFGAGIALMLLALIPIVLARALSPDLTRSDDSHPGFWRYVWLVPTATAAVFVFGAVETAGFSLLPVHGAAIGYSESEAALLLSMVGLGNVVMQVPLGYWSDRIGDRRRLLALCAAIGLAGMLVMPLIQQNWWAVAAMLF
nr:MFS transporter [Rhizobiaceae bacterium]